MFPVNGIPRPPRRLQRERSSRGVAAARCCTAATVVSPREVQVLGLLQEGRTIGEVAKLLHVSLSTAKTHVARVYEKLGASNRAQALMTAVRLGLKAPTVVATVPTSQTSA